MYPVPGAVTAGLHQCHVFRLTIAISAGGSVSRLVFGSLQVLYPGPAHSLTGGPCGRVGKVAEFQCS